MKIGLLKWKVLIVFDNYKMISTSSPLTLVLYSLRLAVAGATFTVPSILKDDPCKLQKNPVEVATSALS